MRRQKSKVENHRAPAAGILPGFVATKRKGQSTAAFVNGVLARMRQRRSNPKTLRQRRIELNQRRRNGKP